MGARSDHAWYLVVPVKPAERGKSRLVSPPGVDHVRLTRALALDTLAAVLADPTIHCLVVTSDPITASWASCAGARTIPDPGAGLNAAIRAGLTQVPGPPAAVLLGDLPALHPTELRTALDSCAACGHGFVADADGTGTVLLAANDVRRLRPQFGAGSARAHRRYARQVGADLTRLRRDVDTQADLAVAVSLGVGRHTRAALAGSSLDVGPHTAGRHLWTV